MRFKYEIVPVGSVPTWDRRKTQEFTVPVAVGDKVLPQSDGGGTELMKVVAVEHYPEVSVLYVE